MPQDEPSPNLMIRIAMPCVVLAVGVIAFFALKSLRVDPPRNSPEVATPVVTTEKVTRHTGPLEIAIDGLVVPHREVTLSAQVAGRIQLKTPACRAGRFVRGQATSQGLPVSDSYMIETGLGSPSQAVASGTLLLCVDPRDYQLDVARLTDEVEQADASLEELKVDVANTETLMQLAEEVVDLQKREMRRVENLSLKRVATDSQIDEAKRSLLAARDAFLKLRNQQTLLNTQRTRLISARDTAQSMLNKSRLDLARTEIRSPLNGVVVRDHVEQDAYVQKGTPLVTIEDTSAIEVKCSLRMEELFWLWQQASSRPAVGASTVNRSIADARQYEIPKTPVTIEYELTGRMYHWQGELARYDGIGLDETTRTVPCRVIVRNPTNSVTPNEPASAATSVGPPALVRGMYVTVKIHATPTTPLLRISERAVRPGRRIWIVRSGKLVIQKVHVARVVGEDVLIDAAASDLHEGDLVVVSPLASASEGMKVEQEKPSQ